MCKTCNKCKITYDNVKNNFHKKSKSFFGVCKKCTSETQMKYRANNKEKVAELNREYRENNKEKAAEYSRKYRANNKEMVVERNRKYRESNKENISEYRKNNKEKVAERVKKRYENNKEKYLLYSRVQFLLRTAGLNRKDVTPDVVEAVETILKIKKQLKV